MCTVLLLQARNLACCVQFKDSDEKNSEPLSVIFSKYPGSIFTEKSNTAVIHHCTTPSFYEEVKVRLPIRLTQKHHLLFIFYHISCDVQKANKSSGKGSTKQWPVESPVGFAWLPILDENGRVFGAGHSLPVATSLPPDYLSSSSATTPSSPTANASSTPGHGRSVQTHVQELKWVDNHKPLFRVCLKLDSSICTDDPLLHQFFCLCEGMQLGSLQEGQDPIIPQEELMVQLRELQNMNLTSAIHFLPSLFKQLFLILCCSSMEAEPAKREVLRLLIVLVDRLVVADKAGLLRTYIEYMFVTELDKTRKKAVHDELARLLVQYLKNEQEGLEIRRLLDHLWFFLEITLKSMAQYLEMANKLAASRKNRYPEDFGWNLQSMSTIILNNIRGRHTEPSAKRANSSLADFVKRSFSFMDRGVVFKIISKYLEAFSVRENITVAQLKLEFLRIVCDHEHFIPLNLPFPIPAEMMEYSLTDEFCRKHFLVGVLLREVESSLQYEAAPVRRKTIKVLRNLLAKHDSDPRCPEAVQKARIAALYFPLVPVVLDHVGRLDGGCPSYVSPMLNATSMACYSNGSSSSSSNTPSNKHKVTPDKHTGHKSSHSKATGTNIPSLLQVPALPRIESEPSLESMTATSPADLSISTATGGGGPSDAAPPLSISPVPFSMEQTVFELNKLTVEETRDLLISVLFVLKHIDPAVLVHWWKKCISSGTRAAVGKFQHASAQQSDRMPPQFSLVLDFFDMLESCLYTFKYHGRQAISMKLSTSSDQQHSREASSSDNMPSTSSTFPSSTVQPSPFASLQPSREKEKPSKRSSVSSTSSSYSGGKSRGGLGGRASTISGVPTANPSASLPPMHLRAIVPPELIEDRVRTEGALSYEVGIVVLGLLQSFEANFKHELSQEEGDNIIMVKYFSLLMLFLQVNQSVSLQTHIFASVRAFIHKFREALFRGSPEYCGILCYEVLHLCNSRVPSTRTEACALLYLLMRCNFEYFKGKGFVRTHLQSTIAVSKIVSTLLGQSDSNLRKSLGTIAAYATQDDSVKGVTFPSEVKDLIKRLKTVLSVTAQMKVHQNDPEKLVDLHYSLAKSYGTSPELRHTWLDSIATLHLKYGNFSEVAHCCIHIAGLVAEYLKIKGKYPAGCGAFHSVSLNVEMEESGIKEDAETGEEQRYTERNLVSLLESSINYLEQAQRYEVMSEVFKVLQPFYEKSRDFKKMTEMYGKLHEAFEKVVSVMTTGKRYLGTYFRVSFFGKLFGEDSDKQYVYKEPTVTTLGEFTLRLQKLYSRKFGSTEIVHIIKESGKVNTSTLDMDQAYVQITHVEPFFAPEELEERVTRFERENKISRFVYETPFSLEDSKAHGDVTKQCIRKTILTSSHWFPYIKKRILVIDQVQFELSAIQVAIEAMSKKTKDLAGVIQMDPPDLKRLQLLLQGSISTQVNQGAQEYANCFLREPHLSQQPKPHTDTLREVYRYFMRVCQDGLELNGRLISTDQLLYQEELRNKFESMQSTLLPLIKLEEESRSRPSSPSSSSEAGAGYTAHNRRPAAGVDPHRMSALLFHSISGNR